MQFAFFTETDELTDIEYRWFDADETALSAWLTAGIVHAGRWHSINVTLPTGATSIRWHSLSHPEHDFTEYRLDERGATSGGGSGDVDEAALAAAVVAALQRPDSPVLPITPQDQWIVPEAGDIKAAGYGSIIDAARTRSTGGVDPVVDAIKGVTAQVRTAVRQGNTLDANPAKIPHSLKPLAVRMVLYTLMRRIGLELNQDQRDEAGRDEKHLAQLMQRKLQVEAADDPDATAGPVNPGCWNAENKLVMRTHPVPTPGRQFTTSAGQYANPEGPEDNAT